MSLQILLFLFLCEYLCFIKSVTVSPHPSYFCAYNQSVAVLAFAFCHLQATSNSPSFDNFIVCNLARKLSLSIPCISRHRISGCFGAAEITLSVALFCDLTSRFYCLRHLTASDGEFGLGAHLLNNNTGVLRSAQWTHLEQRVKADLILIFGTNTISEKMAYVDAAAGIVNAAILPSVVLYLNTSMLASMPTTTIFANTRCLVKIAYKLLEIILDSFASPLV